MAILSNIILVFVAGLITALATGLGAIPFFFYDAISKRSQVFLWGVASGIMAAASIFGLLLEATQYGSYWEIGVGVGIGVALVVVANKVLGETHLEPEGFTEADFKKLLLILGVLTVHSFPEGVAIGVSFAELNLGTGWEFLGFTVPFLAVTMTLAISIHNIPEGLAVSIPLRNADVSNWGLVGWSIFTSLPQPIGAVIAFLFVRFARALLPIGFGFAGGAMLYLVVTEFIPEALETGRDLKRSGFKELVTGVLGGAVLMALFFYL